MSRPRFFSTPIPALAAALLLAGCEGPQNYLSSGGPAAERLADLGWFVLIVFSVVTVAVWLLILWIGLRRRGSLDTHLPVDNVQGQSFMLVGGFAIPVAILTLIFIVTLQTMTAFPMAQAGASSPDIRVTGQQWWFSAQYLEAGMPILNSPTEIHIPVGEPVDLELVTRDVIHSFWIPKLHGKVDLIPGHPNHIRIQADEPGVYAGQCAEYCGVQHAHMRLFVVAQSLDEYEAWVAHQQRPAAEPVSQQARRGRDLFMSQACVLCHTIRGTPARGNIGPELTHLASRKRIAGGMLENNTANLSAWVIHAQSLKPGARMPSLGAFDGEELRAVVSYLQGLE